MNYLFNFGKIKVVKYLPILCWKEVKSFPDNNVWTSLHDYHLHLFGTIYQASVYVPDSKTGEASEEKMKHLYISCNSSGFFIPGLVQQKFFKRRKYSSCNHLAVIPRGAEYSKNKDEIVSNKVVVFKHFFDAIPWFLGILKVREYKEK